jgi:hypothetical protein
MFKILMVVCLVGVGCDPYSETDGRTYATEKACWIVLDRKMEMLPGLSQEPAFQSITAACIPVDSNS